MPLPALPAFFALAFALSWLLWWPLLSGGPAVWHLLGSLGPAAAALAVAGVQGRDARTELRRRIMFWRASPRAWAFALGGPLLLVLTGVLASGFLEGRWPSLAALTRVPEFPGVPFAALLLAEVLFYGFGEEIGWRGFALPRLEARFGALWASALLSVPWALWHLPLLRHNETYAAMTPALLAGWFLSLLTGSVLMGWLWHASGGSVPALAVFHSLLDVAMVNEGVSPLGVNAMGALVTVWGLLAAWALWRRGRRTPSRPSSIPQAP